MSVGMLRGFSRKRNLTFKAVHPMIDNTTLMKMQQPPNALLNASGMPFEYNGIIYSPKFTNGQVIRYEAQIKNLRLYWYADRAYLFNSIHKYYAGNNFGDFTLQHMKAAVEQLQDATGIAWKQARVKKIEFGCNLPVNAYSTYSALLSYRGKDYLPMTAKGKVYGSRIECGDWKGKAYNKGFQVQQVDAVRLKQSLFRWEIAVTRMRTIEDKLKTAPLTVKQLLSATTWRILAEDAVTKYKNSMKMNKLNLHLLSPHEKRIIAAQIVPEIRDDLKHHHNRTYKRDRAIYRRIMKDESICEANDITEVLRAKFEQLISNENICGESELSACNIVGNRYNI